MKNLRNKLVFLNTFLFMLLCMVPIKVEADDVHNDIVTIINGKQYGSFEDYRMEKLLKHVKKKLLLDLAHDGVESAAQWVRKLPPYLLADLDNNQIRTLIQEVALYQIQSISKQQTVPELEQMQEMLDRYYQEKNGVGKPLVDLDETKIRTIYISPGH
ncbi:MAG: hypothetical protein H6755_05080 [Candidatus Omnitrophica bacterium]|nr:hypothetical protein [Candidatus Omnitrophota bacterium]MCB9747765.1 hypothetical protein [Candidatus Omnitrophota bacterium]